MFSGLLQRALRSVGVCDMEPPSLVKIPLFSKLYDRFEWTIHDSPNRLLKTGSKVESPEFWSDGFRWRMTVTTKCGRDTDESDTRLRDEDGDSVDPDSADFTIDSYIDLQLCRIPPSTECVCEFFPPLPKGRYEVRIGVLKANGHEREKAHCYTNSDGFLEVHKLMHYPQHVSCRGSNRFVKDGAFTIFCELAPQVEKAPSNPGDSDTGLLLENLRDLYLNGTNSDLELNVGGKMFKAHKTILCARSSVFSKMFQHNMLEKSSSVVEIPDCSADAFAVFLRYLYTGEMEKVVDHKLICNLFYIADKYNVRELKRRCAKLMTDALSLANFCDFVSLALRHNESRMLKTACEFFTKNLKPIIKSARWQTYLTENPIHANELFIKAVDAMSDIPLVAKKVDRSAPNQPTKPNK